MAQGQGEAPESMASVVGTADAATALPGHEEVGSGSTRGGVVEEPAVEQRGPGTVTGEDPTKILNLSKKERKVRIVGVLGVCKSLDCYRFVLDFFTALVVCRSIFRKLDPMKWIDTRIP